MSEDKKIKYIKQISNDPRFYVRIRLEDENKIDSKIKKSEVYYMGFKVFSVGSSDLITEFDDKFFKFNIKIM